MEHIKNSKLVADNRATNLVTQWMQTVQSELWEHVWEIWDKRNKYIHGDNVEESHRKKLEKTKQQIETVFCSNFKLLAEEKHLLENKEKILNRGNGGRKMWLRSIRLAIQKFEASLEANERDGEKQKANTYLSGTDIRKKHI